MDKISQQFASNPELTSIAIFTLFLLIVATGIIVLVLVYQKRQAQYLRDKEKLKLQFEQEIMASKLEIQEQTFQNISQEIHDNIGQILSLAKLTIKTINTEDKYSLVEKIETSSKLISHAIQDLRDLSRSLNADSVIEVGLGESIETELLTIRKTGRIETNMEVVGNVVRLAHKSELVLFRIFQETLSNTIKHSRATKVSVSLTFNSHSFVMAITDNGIGFYRPPKKASGAHGIGLLNMSNRAAMIGAVLDISSDHGKGTKVSVTVPNKMKYAK